MTRIVLPAQNVPVDENSGVNPIWYERLQQLTAFANLFSEINFAAMTNGYVMKWDATAKKFVAGPDLT
jgi:hypothetical protein